jgi:hypothetical protein
MLVALSWARLVALRVQGSQGCEKGDCTNDGIIAQQTFACIMLSNFALGGQDTRVHISVAVILQAKEKSV